jgi:hypothetical protein
MHSIRREKSPKRTWAGENNESQLFTGGGGGNPTDAPAA